MPNKYMKIGDKKYNADLYNANLREADLSYANLYHADLSYADLRYANLYHADLRYADLRYAKLRGADLSYADLSYANLYNADLYNANLYHADLYHANLYHADLREANLRYANLYHADLRDVNLYHADLRYADLRGADLYNLPVDFINQCSRDMLFIFQWLKSELPAFKNKLISGEVDGSQYEGECSCLVGTFAKIEKKEVSALCKTIPFYDMGTQNIGETWFLNIRKGDTPENNQFSAHVLKLIEMIEEGNIHTIYYEESKDTKL